MNIVDYLTMLKINQSNYLIFILLIYDLSVQLSVQVLLLLVLVLI